MKFDENHVLHDLKHYLPAQAPLKDFIHHNTLHAFQKYPFFEALETASEIFGYNTSVSLQEYRSLYENKKIKQEIVEEILGRRKPKEEKIWQEKLLTKSYTINSIPRIGTLRSVWKQEYKIDMDSFIHPILFRTLCSFLDQGISIWPFPLADKTFLEALHTMEMNSFASIFKTHGARELFLNKQWDISFLLDKLVGDESLYTHYLFDQQFTHSGWSGMVSSVEDLPGSLLDTRKIALKELIIFELLLEIDTLSDKVSTWKPLKDIRKQKPVDLFSTVPRTEYFEVLSIWQEAFEWSYYDEVLAGISIGTHISNTSKDEKSFQAIFCIDDRECSFRRYLERFDPFCETFGTPGFFGVEFFFKPENGKFNTKVCPAPVTPKYLIKEVDSTHKHEKDLHFSKHAHSFHSGWLISQTLGFWSAFKLFVNIFRPSMGPTVAYSLKHMDKNASLTVEYQQTNEDGLQVGFQIEEMANRVEGMLKSIGLVDNFAPIVYVVGHGASSINNPHYSAYDCGACSGRAGPVNARAFSHMANHPEVRTILSNRGIIIPEYTQFVGSLHDTTRDEIAFFDEMFLSENNKKRHTKNEALFKQASAYNSRERSRRFESIKSEDTPKNIHQKIFKRSVSLFEPRPELNHATNALCIVGRREITKHLFLDRRSFLNSYDYRVDPEGKYLLNILDAATPVCGGINLEYYFSRVDNPKLGAGSKLPHNVMGLFGVANGTDGDLRPGLPSQMIEVHDPVRLLLIVEHYPEIVLKTIQTNPATYEWYQNNWVHLIVYHPEERRFYRFLDGIFTSYTPAYKVPIMTNVDEFITKTQENIPVHSLIPFSYG